MSCCTVQVVVCGADSAWKLILLVAMLVAFAAIGIGSVINPDWGIRHFGPRLRGGGELRKEWNHLGMAFAGLAFGGFAIYLIYVALRDCF